MATLSEIQAGWSANPDSAPTQSSGTKYAGQYWERGASGNWYPAGHAELAKQGLWAGSTPTGSTPAPPAGGTSTEPGTAQSNIQQQAQNASTYTQSAGGTLQKNTANAGTQDVLRNSYLQRAAQGTQIDTNDPNFRQQADTFAAGVERQKRDYLDQQAESLGPMATGAMRGQQRMAAEQAGRAVGGFEAELVGRELQTRRDEISDALKGLFGMINADQQAALQRELAQLDADIRRLGINRQADSDAARNQTQRDLGYAGIDLDYARLKQQQRQFADQLGFDISKWEYDDPWY